MAYNDGLGGPYDGLGSCGAGVGPWWSWIYDPTQGTGGNAWTQVPDMQERRYYPSALLTEDGHVMVLAGNQVSPDMNYEVYDPQTGPPGAWLSTSLLQLPDYSTVPSCGMVYPQAKLLEAAVGDGSNTRSVAYVSTPYVYAAGRQAQGSQVSARPAAVPMGADVSRRAPAPPEGMRRHHATAHRGSRRRTAEIASRLPPLHAVRW